MSQNRIFARCSSTKLPIVPGSIGCSGYIPSSVCGCSQYRTRHFPTLSTRHSQTDNDSDAVTSTSLADDTLHSTTITDVTDLSTTLTDDKLSTLTDVTQEINLTTVNDEGFKRIQILRNATTSDHSSKSMSRFDKIDCGKSYDWQDNYKNQYENTLNRHSTPKCQNSPKPATVGRHSLKNSCEDSHFEKSSAVRCTLAEEDSIDDTLDVTVELVPDGSDCAMRLLRESITVSLRNHEVGTIDSFRNPMLRESRSVPRELDPCSLSYEARLARNPLNLCIESLDQDNLSFPGGLYNIPQHRSSLSSQSLDTFDSVSSSTTSSPCKTPRHEISCSPSKVLRPSPHHHPHLQNHLSQHHLQRRLQTQVHARSEPPPLLA